MWAGDEHRDEPVSSLRRLFIRALPCSYARGDVWRGPLICCSRETSQPYTVMDTRSQGTAVEGYFFRSFSSCIERGLWSFCWEMVHSGSDMDGSGRRPLRVRLNWLVWHTSDLQYVSNTLQHVWNVSLILFSLCLLLIVAMSDCVFRWNH